MEMIKLEHSFPLGTSHKHCRVFQTKATERITLGVVDYSEFGDGSKEVTRQHGREENLWWKAVGVTQFNSAFCYCDQLKLKRATPV